MFQGIVFVQIIHVHLRYKNNTEMQIRKWTQLLEITINI